MFEMKKLFLKQLIITPAMIIIALLISAFGLQLSCIDVDTEKFPINANLWAGF